MVGIILIDSSSRNQDFHKPLPPKNSKNYRELITFDTGRMQLKNSEPFPSILLIVLTATSQQGEETGQKKLWQEWQKELTKLSPKGIQILAWGSSHYIQKQQPQLVIDAIYSMIKLNNLDR